MFRKHVAFCIVIINVIGIIWVYLFIILILPLEPWVNFLVVVMFIFFMLLFVVVLWWWPPIMNFGIDVMNFEYFPQFLLHFKECSIKIMKNKDFWLFSCIPWNLVYRWSTSKIFDCFCTFQGISNKTHELFLNIFE